MKINMTLAALGTALLLTSLSTSVFAATSKPGGMTCEEFVALDDVEKPKVVYFEEGLSSKDKPVDAAVDVGETDTLVPVLVSACEATPKALLSKKIMEHSAARKASMPSSAATSAPVAALKPGSMTCSDFVALEDVVKPKVVYWAEGLNKKGKPMDSVVDLDETDKLVPVVIQECQKTPKLSFWQAIKKHF